MLSLLGPQRKLELKKHVTSTPSPIHSARHLGQIIACGRKRPESKQGRRHQRTCHLTDQAQRTSVSGGAQTCLDRGGNVDCEG